MNHHPADIIDPDGEVIIVLRDANSPFAYAAGDMVPRKTSHGLPKPYKFPSWERASDDAATEEVVTDEAAAEKQTQDPMDGRELRIQVSAKHLTFASSFFKNTLTGRWKESETYQQQGSVEIIAEDWDSEALLIILRAMHCQYNLMPQKVTLEMLAKIATIADYYDCKDVLWIMEEKWIKSLDEKGSICPRDLILWVWVSWFFKLPTQFTESTSKAMSWSYGLIDGRGLPIPDKVIGSMNKSRQEAIGNVVSLLHETREAFLNGNRGCGFECKSIMYGALTMQMQSNNLLSPKPTTPFYFLKYDNLIQMVPSFRSPRWSESSADISKRRPTYCHDCPDSSFTSLFENLNHSIEGLDLDILSTP